MLRAALPPALALAGVLALVGPGGAGSPALTGRTVAAAATRLAPATAAPATAAPATAAAAPRPVRTPAATAAPLRRARPTRVVVPAIGVAAPVLALGLLPDGSLEVPVTRADTGWFEPGAAPGEAGPAVIAGHVSLAKGAAVFARLDRLRPGDVVEVDRDDGLTARFAVRRVERHPKDAFPTEAVYGPTQAPELRLVTCGGELDRRTGRFRDNVIVYATYDGAVGR